MEIDVLAAQYAKSKGKTVILDCGGRDDPISEDLLLNLDYISPNQTELARLDPTINLDDIVNEVRNKLISKYPNLKVWVQATALLERSQQSTQSWTGLTQQSKRQITWLQ